ncbi:MAG TPA: cytochrome c [Kofleriaceae bacterium]|jgi:cytochrome c553|nr:cytochrome c [Kofleriaceae bacterium]
MRSLVIAIPFALTVLAGACGKNSEPPPPSSGTPNARQESGPTRPADGQLSQAQAMFNTVCVMCHGADGTGTGPAAAALNPKPRNYTDAAWQASVTDGQIKDIILKGGAGVGKSPLMPAQPQLADKPEVLDGLVKLIRGFGKHP